MRWQKICKRTLGKQTYFPFQGGIIFLNQKGEVLAESKTWPLELGFTAIQQLCLAVR